MNLIKIHKNDNRLKSFEIDENIFNQIEKEKGNVITLHFLNLHI